MFTFGYHKPGAFTRDRSLGPLVLSSASRAVGDPHSAKDLKPSLAIWFSPQKVKFVSWVAPITSEKWVNQIAKGKSLGWVSFDQIPSKINWKKGL